MSCPVLALLLLAAPPSSSGEVLRDCREDYRLFSHFTLVGFVDSDNNPLLAVRELYDPTECCGGREAVQCGYEGLSTFWKDVQKRVIPSCHMSDKITTWAVNPGGVRIHILPIVPGWGYTAVSGVEGKPAGKQVFTVYSGVFDKKDCTSPEASKAALQRAKEFASKSFLTLEGFRTIPLGNRMVRSDECLPGHKKPACTQTLAVKLPDRSWSVRLEMTTLVQPVREKNPNPSSSDLTNWSFEVVPTITEANDTYRIPATLVEGIVVGSSWTVLGPCELYSDGYNAVLKISIVKGGLEMGWEEARFIQVLE